MSPFASTTCDNLAASSTCNVYVLSGTSTPPLYVPVVSAGDIGTMFFMACMVVLLGIQVFFKP